MNTVPPLHVLRGYLDNLQVNLNTVQYTKVPPTWGTTVTTPDVTRLYYFREGEGWIAIRNRTYTPQRGQLFLLPAGQTISFDTHAERTFGKYWCHFTATVGDVNLFRFIQLPHYVDVPDEAWLEQQFQNLINLYHNPSLSSPLRIKAILLDIIAMFMDESSLSRGDEIQALDMADLNKINTILMYIDEHLDTHITLDDLAQLVHFHPQYLVSYFKIKLGISPIAYINRRRIEVTKPMLAEQDKTISDVAHEVGLEAYYFSRLFKQQTGLSPSEYRKTLVNRGSP